MTGAGLGCAVCRRMCLCRLDPGPGHGLPSTLLQPSSARHKLSLVTPPILGSPVTGQTQQLWLRTARQTWHRGARGTACLPSPQLSGGPVSPGCWPLALKMRARPASPWDTLRIQGPSGCAACLQAFQQARPWAAVPASSSSLPLWGSSPTSSAGSLKGQSHCGRGLLNAGCPQRPGIHRGIINCLIFHRKNQRHI